MTLIAWLTAHKKAVAAFAGSELAAVVTVLALDHVTARAAVLILLAPLVPGYAAHKATNT